VLAHLEKTGVGGLFLKKRRKTKELFKIMEGK